MAEHDSLSNIAVRKELKVEHKFSKIGDYLVQLNVIDTLTGQLMLNQASNMFQVRDREQPFITCADTVMANHEIALNGNKTYLPDKQIVGYYWDFNDGTIATGKEVKHIFDEPGTYKIFLGVAYTDPDNKKVTESRFKNIVVLKPQTQ